MKCYLGSLLAMATMVVYSTASTPCIQPLEVRSHDNKTLIHKYYCNQVVHQVDLQTAPEILYDAPLPHDYKYTLFLLEKNNNTRSFKLHWLITDIIPMNKSLTANKTVVEEYRPAAMNNDSTMYECWMFKHLYSLNLTAPTFIEKDNFIPETWAAPFKNVTLLNKAMWRVTGKNISHPHTTAAIHPHSSTTAHFTETTFQSPKTTSQPITQINTDKRPGYNLYNTTNSSSTHHISTSRPHKSGAGSNVYSLTLIFIPLIPVITKVIF